MTDIVQRLRKGYDMFASPLEEEAADEIEKLRAYIAKLEQVNAAILALKEQP